MAVTTRARVCMCVCFLFYCINVFIYFQCVSICAEVRVFADTDCFHTYSLLYLTDCVYRYLCVLSETNTLPLMTRDVETALLTVKSARTLRRAQRAMKRGMLNTTGRVENTTVRGTTEVTDVIGRKTKLQLSWTGHLVGKT